MVGRFLAGIGAVVWAPALARYVLLQRSPDKDFGPGVWECVTGRVDQGEGFAEALVREVSEELGVTVEVDFVIGTTHFYRGTSQPDNELLGVVYHCSLSTPEAIRLSAEHTAVRWVTLAEARDVLRPENSSEAWLLRVLERATALRTLLPVEVIEMQRLGMEMG
ncbi:MAG: NUDIX domain-containing protein [Anaerolineae bacterium]|nr:NUDIX domain-containing protein [Anaerolineae bacterium]